MAIAETLTLAKALSTAGGLASSYGPAAASMKRTKEQKELTKKRQAEEQKLAKTQGTPKAEDVAAAKNPIEAALTQQRAMLARGQQTGMQQAGFGQQEKQSWASRPSAGQECCRTQTPTTQHWARRQRQQSYRPHWPSSAGSSPLRHRTTAHQRSSQPAERLPASAQRPSALSSA